MTASRLKILVIDDMAGVRESLRAALQAAGFDVTTANNGREGLGALAAVGSFQCEGPSVCAATAENFGRGGTGGASATGIQRSLNL